MLKLICFPSEKGSSLKKKFGSKFFPFRVDLCGPRCLVEKRVDPNRSGHVGKPSSAYGWPGGFSPGSPVFTHLW